MPSSKSDYYFEDDLVAPHEDPMFNLGELSGAGDFSAYPWPNAQQDKPSGSATATTGVPHHPPYLDHYPQAQQQQQQQQQQQHLGHETAQAQPPVQAPSLNQVNINQILGNLSGYQDFAQLNAYQLFSGHPQQPSQQQQYPVTPSPSPSPNLQPRDFKTVFRAKQKLKEQEQQQQALLQHHQQQQLAAQYYAAAEQHHQHQLHHHHHHQQLHHHQEQMNGVPYLAESGEVVYYSDLSSSPPTTVGLSPASSVSSVKSQNPIVRTESPESQDLEADQEGDQEQELDFDVGEADFDHKELPVELHYGTDVKLDPSASACGEKPGKLKDRKATHSASEKRRRDNLKDGFCDLQKRIPGCPSHSSKGVVLKKAAEYIDFLVQQKVGAADLQEGNELKKKLKFTTEFISCMTKQKTKLQEENDRLKAENQALREKLEAYHSSIEATDLVKSGVNSFVSTVASNSMKLLALAGVVMVGFWNPFTMSNLEHIESTGRAILNEKLDYTTLMIDWLVAALMFGIKSLFMVLAGYWLLSYDSLPASDSKAFLMAQFERKMGKEDLLNDEPNKGVRQEHFRKALMYMGVPLPHTTIGLVGTLMFQLLRQAIHWLPFGNKLDRFLTKVFHNEKSVMEIANNYFMLSQEFFSNSQFPLEGWVCLLRALNLAESLGPSPLLVNVYCSMAFQLATRLPLLCTGRGGLFSYFYKMGVVTERNASLGKKSIGWTILLDAWGKTAFGELDTAARKFEMVSNICEESGWHSMAWQSKIFKVVIECIKGDLRTAEKSLGVVKATSTSKSLAQEYWICILDFGISVMKDETMERAFEILERMTRIRAEWTPKGTAWFNTVEVLDTISSSFHTFALYRTRDPIAIVHAEKCVARNRDSSYVVFSGTHVCLRALCEVAAGVWRDLLAGGSAAEPWKGIEIDRLRNILKESLTILHNLSTLYVVAEATWLYYRGVVAKLEGDAGKAKKILEKGLVVSKKLNLRLEEGLFLTELSLLNPQPTLESLLHACDLIEASGATFHLSLARKFLNLETLAV